MTVPVKFFAFLEEKLGFQTVNLDISDFETIKQFKDYIKESYPAITDDIQHCLVAVDFEIKADYEQLAVEKEIAIFPAVSGG